MKVSGYVPFYNNASTVLAAVVSLRQQEPPLDEVFAVDDGSTDGSAVLLEQAGVRVLSQPGNLGRGAVRARAMLEARNELVLSCDATNALPPDFAWQTLPWFDDPAVAAVFGRIVESRNQTAVERWRARHLFKNNIQFVVRHQSSLMTGGTMVRRSVVEAVGGFDTRLRHTEDAELGERLLASNFDIVFDPRLEILSIGHNTVSQVLERYWRWYVGKQERTSFQGFLSQINYAVKVMACEDIKQGDWLAAGISLLSPHYCWWRNLAKFTNWWKHK